MSNAASPHKADSMKKEKETGRIPGPKEWWNNNENDPTGIACVARR